MDFNADSEENIQNEVAAGSGVRQAAGLCGASAASRRVGRTRRLHQCIAPVAVQRQREKGSEKWDGR
jgi:hypothetical protein